MVELVEDEPAAGGSGLDPANEWLRRVRAAAVRGARRAARFVVPRAARAWRRPVVRWVTLGVAAAMVAVPVADASRERTRLAALAQIPGVVRPLHPGMTARYSLEGGDATLMASGTLIGGTVVAAPVTVETVNNAPPAAPAVVGLDPATGKRRWSVTLAPLDATGTVEFPMCNAAGSVAVCTAQEAVAGRYSTSLWVLDPPTGRVLRSANLGEHGWAAVAAGQVVVARQVDGPDRAPATGPWTVTWRVTGQDAATGATGWTWTSPPVEVAAVVQQQNLTHDPTDYASSLSATSSVPPTDDAVLTVGDDAWVFAPGGAVRTHISRPGGWMVSEVRGALVRRPVPSEIDLGNPNFDPQGAGELQLADGTWRAIQGGGIQTRVDDGSAPGVIFLAAGAGDQSLATLTAVDSRTGSTLWSTPVPEVRYAVNGVILGDRLYVATQRLGSVGEDRVTAYDAKTGAVAWTKAGLGPGIVATDGTVLLTAPVDSYGFSNTVQASALEDGRPLWREDLRAVAFPVGTAQGNLMGFAALPAIRAVGAWRADGSLTALG